MIGTGEIGDSGYIYRVGEGLLRLSTHSTDADKTYAECAGRGIPGTYKLMPRWREDYVAIVRKAITWAFITSSSLGPFNTICCTRSGGIKRAAL